ncbi:MAG: histidine--tRNA ligase [Dehalococcoidia bacterium]
MTNYNRIQNPRGTLDVLPEDQYYWDLVRSSAEQIAQQFGHQRIDTPVFEATSLFSRTVGEGTDIVEKEMYTFNDRGDESLTLRPEGTAPVSRAYIQHGMHSMPQPVRLYYITPIFRYERPQSGRFRQHWQFGVEAIGDESALIDAEVIHLLWSFLVSLGLKDIKLLINSIGDSNCRPKYLDQLQSYYSKYKEQICDDCKVRLQKNPLRLLDCKQPSCQTIKSDAPNMIDHLCTECNEHFTSVRQLLEMWHIPYDIDTNLVRGLDYYTKTVFEIHPERSGSQTALGAGGRYDGLIEQIGGANTPGVGFGSGIERIIMNLKEQNTDLKNDIPQKISLYIAHIGDESKEISLRLLGTLRNLGIQVNASSKSRSLKAQLRSANTMGVTHSLILGPDEIEHKQIKILEMGSGEESKIQIDQVETYFQQKNRQTFNN